MGLLKDIDLTKRSDEDEIKHQSDLFNNTEILKTILNNMTEIAMVVNKNRQVIFSNEILLNILGFNYNRKIYGLRPGELINCVNAYKSEFKCGNSAGCKYCSILNVILNSQKKEGEIVDEVNLTIEDGDIEKNLELLVKAVSIKVKKEVFTLVFLFDISEKKKREVLERIFYHDLINKAGGLAGLIDLLYFKSKDQSNTFISGETIYLLRSSIQGLIEEILAQRDLIMIEKGELQLKLIYIKSLDLIYEKIEFFEGYVAENNKSIDIIKNSEDIEFPTNKAILGRILDNLIKNALEASDEGMKVLIGCFEKNDNIEFIVKNETEMDEEAKYKIFNRSFSTKSKNRGIGTYSVKLLTENYLKGKVHFVSKPDLGTVFYISIPKSY